MKVLVENETLYHKRNEIDKLEKEEEKKNRKKRRNIGIVITLTFLIMLAVLNMTSVKLEEVYFKGLVSIKNYYMYMSLGIGVMFFITSRIDYKSYENKRIQLILIIISIASLLIVYFGPKFSFLKAHIPQVNGAIGWIRFGSLSIQPSEMMKLPFIIVLAKLLAKGESERYKTIGIVANVMGIISLYLFLVILQKDMGTMIHYVAIAAVMLFVSKVNLKVVVGLTTAFLGFAGMFFYYIMYIGDKLTYNYRYKRVVSYLDGIFKNEYDLGTGYQVAQSLMAFGRGGVLGEGYANGVQKYNYLPEANTDFVLSTFGEEFGFLGMFILLFLFLLLFNLIKSTAVETKDYFGKYLAFGIGGYLITQVLINIYVALGMLPVFGIPMPVFSWGGTSLVTVFAALGIVININKQR